MDLRKLHYFIKIVESGSFSKGSRQLFAVQLAKMASAIWAVTAKEQSFQKGFQSVRPNTAGAAA